MDTTIKDIQEYEELYAVTTDGRVWSYPKRNGPSYRNGHWMKLNRNKGYLQVNLCKNGKYKWFGVHRLVAFAFLQKKEEYTQVNHLNGLKHDNRVENLQWCTPSENCLHSYKLGTSQAMDLKGEKNPNSKLSTREIIQIKQLNKTFGVRDLAKMFCISKSHVSYIIHNKAWKHL